MRSLVMTPIKSFQKTMYRKKVNELEWWRRQNRINKIKKERRRLQIRLMESAALQLLAFFLDVFSLLSVSPWWVRPLILVSIIIRYHSIQFLYLSFSLFFYLLLYLYLTVSLTVPLSLSLNFSSLSFLNSMLLYEVECSVKTSKQSNHAHSHHLNGEKVLFKINQNECFENRLGLFERFRNEKFSSPPRMKLE